MTLKPTLLLLLTFVFSFSFGQTKLEDLKIDTSITGFRFAADLQGTNFFTRNGPTDLQTVNPTGFAFTILPGWTVARGKKQLESLRKLSEQDGYTVSGLVEKDTTLHGYPAYYISYVETKEGRYTNNVFNSFVIKNNTLILFVSGDLDNGKYTDKFRKTFYSIKL